MNFKRDLISSFGQLSGPTRLIDLEVSNFTRLCKCKYLTICKFDMYIMTTCDQHGHFCDHKMTKIDD